MDNMEFEATIVETGTNEKGIFVILNSTFFYPEGKGGSLGDRGTVGNANITQVTEDNGRIYHYVDSLPSDKVVKCSIDPVRRQDLSVQHTAQHIVSQALERMYGIQTLSFHMGENITTIDVDSTDIGAKMIRDAEVLANSIVLENRLVKKYFVNESDLERLKLRKKIDIEGPIRIVEVEGFDISMCGGMHVDFTGQVGIIKIIKQEKFKKTLSRLYFVAGTRALLDYQKKTEIINGISEFLTTGEDELVNKINLLDKQIGDLLRENRKLREELLKKTANDIFNTSESVASMKIALKEIPDLSREDLTFLGKFLSSNESFASMVFTRGENLFAVLSFGTNTKADSEALKSSILNLTSGRAWGGKGVLFIDCEVQFLEGVKKIFFDSFNKVSQ